MPYHYLAAGGRNIQSIQLLHKQTMYKNWAHWEGAGGQSKIPASEITILKVTGIKTEEDDHKGGLFRFQITDNRYFIFFN